MRVPPGFSMESIPQPQSANIGYAGYRCESRFDGGQFSTQRVLKINGIFFRTEQYSQVRDFFSKVQTGDEQQAVLQGGAVDAQK
jgi:hypothetical protein